MKKRFLPLIAAALFALLATSCVIVDDTQLTIANDSNYVLNEIYITSVESNDWGPDLLGATVLFPGEALEISLECGDWDVLIVDEFGAQCEVYNEYLCFEDAIWSIDDIFLSGCGW